MTTVTLTGNFLATARCLVFSDAGGLSWAFNSNTNTLTASATAGGTFLSSVGLADTSTTPIYVVSNSPLTANGTLDITLATQVRNLVFAGPASGANAQPTFRALVTADLPAGTTPVGANPTALVGLAAVNGSAVTFLRSDGAPALDQSIAPTWTGQHTFTPSAATTAIIVNTTANNVGVSVRSGSGSGAIVEVCGDGSGTGNGLSMTQTSVGAGLINLNFNAALTFKVNGTNRMVINADGGMVYGAPTGGVDEGAGTINAQGLYVNGNQLTGANPTTGIGIVTVNGSATTWMRSDAAPALDQSIAPTWTGNHTFTPAANVAITINARPTGQVGMIIQGITSTDGHSELSLQRAGSHANNVGQGPAVQLVDTTNTRQAVLQLSGGQFELWLYNGSAFTQVFGVTGAPTTGTATASMTASNKPGANQTTPTAWLPIVYSGGTVGYIPVYA